ncbi:alpha/beta fold hydrolase [Acinetobacter larvae]|uniref:Alpha/beta hydrolase n=1 Tax=Acinetobacter larvae TaxID=1789224 RepID=A0A1B2LY19_9GAMM|nr:alpha/beta hydrolase [Acinetobacter larvae]AOA57848.1 alpha/beta hydrolase [Acinetobacter larvae]
MTHPQPAKAIIHFAHANGVPSKVYQKLFDLLQDEYDIRYVPMIGPDKRYPISNQWHDLVDQIIDSVVQQTPGRNVIGLGHSLGSILTMQAAKRRPDLFKQVILLDPPLIMGKQSLFFHFTKLLRPKMVDQITPAGLSKRRRDHWESREQAAALLRPKGFYKDFDAACFDAYIQHALRDDARGGVCLSIPKADEVQIFRTNPSHWWLPSAKATTPMHVVVGDKSQFYQRGFIQMAKAKWGLDYTLTQGSHMFPLEHPQQTVNIIKQLIAQQN